MSRRESAAALSSIRSAAGRPALEPDRRPARHRRAGRRLRRSGRGAGRAAAGPPPVSVAPAVQRTVADSEEFSGRLEATEQVELRPRVGRHDRQGALHRRRDGPQGRAAVHHRPAPVRGRGWRAPRRSSPPCKARSELAQSELARADKLLDRRPCRGRNSTSSRRARAPRRPTSRAPRRRCASRASTSTTRRCARRSRAASRAPMSRPATSSASSRC